MLMSVGPVLAVCICILMRSLSNLNYVGFEMYTFLLAFVVSSPEDRDIHFSGLSLVVEGLSNQGIQLKLLKRGLREKHGQKNCSLPTRNQSD